MNKSKLELELEIMLTAKYCEIILQILRNHKSLSIIKTATFSYLDKKNLFIDRSIYTARHSIDIFYKSISQLSGLYEDFCNNLPFIISALHLLIENGKIALTLNELIYIECGEIFIKDNSFINKAIAESKKYSDRQFLKEVVNNV